MKLTNQQIIKIIDTLNEISEQNMPILLTYQIIEILEELFKVYSPYQKSIEKLEHKYGVKNELFKKEALLLLNMQKEIDINKLKKKDLVEANISLSPFSLVALKPIIEESENGEHSTTD